jgi:hypothetical protein
MEDQQIHRHGLILVFEYNNEYITSLNGISLDTPHQLLAMDKDLEISYNLAIDQFEIPRENITIVTDVIPKVGSKRPWGDLISGGKNPRIVQLPYPEITYIIREIAQFIENTIRGIDDVVLKGKHKNNEVFIYISCHGAQVPLDGKKDNALIFTTKLPGNIFQRRYLKANDIFKLFFGHNVVNDDGYMLVPITKRTKIYTSSSNIFIYEDKEQCRFRLTPTKSVTPLSKRKDYHTKVNRGLPLGTHMLVIFDTCHSASMSDFHYVYDAGVKEMIETSNPPQGFLYPYCVSLSASEDVATVPSTYRGSPFTSCVYEIFKSAKCGITIQEFHDHIYKIIPIILKTCKPTISSTIANHNSVVPFLSHMEPCKILFPSESK